MISINYIDDDFLLSDESENKDSEDNSLLDDDTTQESKDKETKADSSSNDAAVESKDDKETKADSSSNDDDTVVESKDKETKADSSSNDAAVESKDKETKVDSSNKKEKDSDKENVNFPHLIGKKIGMTQLFFDDGNSFPVTVLEVGPCYVTQIKKEKTDGYNSIQLGFEDLKNPNKSQNGHFSKINILPKKYLKEFRNIKNSDCKLGDVITINQFNLGDFVKVTGTSKGKGFTGHMKRHGFGGGRRSHGKNSVMRKAGSVGAGSDPSRVFPGMKMAGRKGNYKNTIKNLSVIKINQDNNLIFISGSVPGANNGLIYLSKSKKI